MKIFEDNLDLLKVLFDEKTVSDKVERLKIIHENSENSWRKNLDLYRGQEIKYILICEAPPYSETEIPVYFYNQVSSTFHRKIWKIFFGNEKMPSSLKETFEQLANKGFLLIDNFPYSMKFQSKDRRKRVYEKILENSLEWTINKLNHNKIKLAGDVKIAFGFKINALQFIKLTKGKVNLKNLMLEFDEKNIGTDGSGFPNSSKIYNIFFSNEKSEYSAYKYYNGETENPYSRKDENQLDFLNPKSLFWYYEKGFHCSKTESDDVRSFIENLIHNRLSEYIRSDYDLWEMYFSNAVK